MQILRYKKMSNGLYNIVLSNGKTMKVYEEVILKYNLLLNKELDAKTIIDVLNDNEEYEVYYLALNNLKRRAKTKKEIEEYLVKKEYNKKHIDSAINKLLEQKYLDDERYAVSYLNEQLITTKNGPKKIEVNMLKKGIDKDIVDEVISEYTIDLQEEKIIKIIDNMTKANRNKGPLVLKNKIISKLKIDGFDDNLIKKHVNNLNLKQDSNMYQKEYDKLYNKYKNKYSGEKLNYFIRNKLYQKGFRNEKSD